VQAECEKLRADREKLARAVGNFTCRVRSRFNAG
jgi:hypothetical protein